MVCEKGQPEQRERNNPCNRPEKGRFCVLKGGDGFLQERVMKWTSHYDPSQGAISQSQKKGDRDEKNLDVSYSCGGDR